MYQKFIKVNEDTVIHIMGSSHNIYLSYDSTLVELSVRLSKTQAIEIAKYLKQAVEGAGEGYDNEK